MDCFTTLYVCMYVMVNMGNSNKLQPSNLRIIGFNLSRIFISKHPLLHTQFLQKMLPIHHKNILLKKLNTCNGNTPHGKHG